MGKFVRFRTEVYPRGSRNAISKLFEAIYVLDLHAAGVRRDSARDARGDASRFVLNDFYTIEPGTVADFLERTVLIDTYAPNHAEFERQYRESAARAL